MKYQTWTFGAGAMALTALLVAAEPATSKTDFSLLRPEAAITVDGKLDDWKELSIVCQKPAQILRDAGKWKGPADCSFRWGAKADDKYLYIAVQVTDDKVLLAQADTEPWKQDGVEVRIDGRSEAKIAAEGPGGDFDPVLPIAVSPTATPDKPFVWQVDQIPAGSKVACLKTETGYNVEIAIPVWYLKQAQGADWKTARINVAVDDCDAAGGEVAQLWWQPDWRGDANIPGSGMFRRQ